MTDRYLISVLVEHVIEEETSAGALVICAVVFDVGDGAAGDLVTFRVDKSDGLSSLDNEVHLCLAAITDLALQDSASPPASLLFELKGGTVSVATVATALGVSVELSCVLCPPVGFPDLAANTDWLCVLALSLQTLAEPESTLDGTLDIAFGDIALGSDTLSFPVSGLSLSREHGDSHQSNCSELHLNEFDSKISEI